MNEQINSHATKNELFFPHVAARLKDALGLENDAALAAALGLSRSNYANKKSSGVVPYEAVLCLCKERGLSMEWVLFGVKSKFTKNDQLEAMPLAPILGCILTELNREFVRAAKDAPTKWNERVPKLHDLGTLAGLVFDKVKWSSFKDSKAQIKAIRDEVVNMTNVFWLMQLTEHINKLASEDEGAPPAKQDEYLP